MLNQKQMKKKNRHQKQLKAVCKKLLLVSKKDYLFWNNNTKQINNL